jgi:uncharacterized protein (DUF1800 family)
MRVRRQTLAAVLATAALLWTAPGGQVSAERDNAVPAKPDERTIQHVLNRITFGARPGDIQRVQQLGLAKFIDQQLNPEHIADAALEARLAEFPTLTMKTSELAEKYYRPAQAAQRAQQLRQKAEDPAAMMNNAAASQPPAPSPELVKARQSQQMVLNDLTQAHLLRAVMSERQLDEVLVDFWFNHFNVFVGKGQVREYLPEYERDVIRPNVLGSFRDLLGAVAHSPAMLFYLDNWQSSAPNAGPVLPPQVAARLGDPRTPPAQRQLLLERMQQLQNQRRTRGLNENYGRELMELHTLGVDGGYTQKDVVDVARALTGWTIDRPQLGGGFVFRPEMHDAGEKIILGQRFPAGHGQDEGERVLDLLAAHPSTAHHLAYQLAQRFVADEPPAALVDRAAHTFLTTKGDLRQVVRTIVTSPEFFAPAAYHAKMKTPLEFVVSVARASNALVANPQPIAQALRTQLGMPLFGCQPPTGYSNTADAWVNTGALLSRMNFALQLVGGQSRGLQVDVNALAPDTSEATRERLLHTLLAGEASDGTRQVLAKAETPAQLLALTLGSPEFQRR